MVEGKGRPYLYSTENILGKEYDSLMSFINSVLQQQAAMVRRCEFKKVVAIIDEPLLDSEEFLKFLELFGPKAENIVSVYIPEEEEVIKRLKRIGSVKADMLDELRKHGTKRTIKILTRLVKLKSKYDLSISIEISREPRIESIVRIVDSMKPDLIVLHRDYLKEMGRELSSTVVELITRLEHPILLFS